MLLETFIQTLNIQKGIKRLKYVLKTLAKTTNNKEQTTTKQPRNLEYSFESFIFLERLTPSPGRGRGLDQPQRHTPDVYGGKIESFEFGGTGGVVGAAEILGFCLERFFLVCFSFYFLRNQIKKIIIE